MKKKIWLFLISIIILTSLHAVDIYETQIDSTAYKLEKVNDLNVLITKAEKDKNQANLYKAAGVIIFACAFLYIPYETVEMQNNQIVSVQHGNSSMYYGLGVGGGLLFIWGHTSKRDADARIKRYKKQRAQYSNTHQYLGSSGFVLTSNFRERP